MTSAEHSKVVVLVDSLFIVASPPPPKFFYGGYVRFALFFVHYLVSFLLLQSSPWGRETWLLYFNCLLMAFDCWRSLSLPHSAFGWSAVCDCGIYSLTFPCDFTQFKKQNKKKHCKYHKHGSVVS